VYKNENKLRTERVKKERKCVGGIKKETKMAKYVMWMKETLEGMFGQVL
jgi:hypothetical protein